MNNNSIYLQLEKELSELSLVLDDGDKKEEDHLRKAEIREELQSQLATVAQHIITSINTDRSRDDWIRELRASEEKTIEHVDTMILQVYPQMQSLLDERLASIGVLENTIEEQGRRIREQNDVIAVLTEQLSATQRVMRQLVDRYDTIESQCGMQQADREQHNANTVAINILSDDMREIRKRFTAVIRVFNEAAQATHQRSAS